MRLLLLMLLLLAAPLLAQEEADKAQHDALRAVRDQAVAAVNKADFAALKSLMDERIVFTPMNAEVCHGPAEVQAYFDKMLKGPDPIVKAMKISSVEVDRLTDLYQGTTGVASGTCTGEYSLKGGMQFTIVNRWSSTLVKEGNSWKIASIHFSSNVFDNPILDLNNRFHYALIGGLAVLVIVAFVLGRWSKR